MNSILFIGFVIDKTKYVCIENYKKYEILGYCLLDYKSSKTKYVTRKGLSDWFNSPEFSGLWDVEKLDAVLGIADILDYKYVAHSSEYGHNTLLKTADNKALEDFEGYKSDDDIEFAEINLFDIAGGIAVNGNNLICFSALDFVIFNMRLTLYSYYNIKSGEKFLSRLRIHQPFYSDSGMGSGCYDILCELGFTDFYKRPCDEMVIITLDSCTLVLAGKLDTLVLDREITKYRIMAKASMPFTVVLHDRLEYLDLSDCYNCTLVSSRYWDLSILADVVRSIYLDGLVIRLEANAVCVDEIGEKIRLWKDLYYKEDYKSLLDAFDRGEIQAVFDRVCGTDKKMDFRGLRIVYTD